MVKGWVFFTAFLCATVAMAADVWPDGTEIDPWFGDVKPVEIATLG